MFSVQVQNHDNIAKNSNYLLLPLRNPTLAISYFTTQVTKNIV